MELVLRDTDEEVVAVVHPDTAEVIDLAKTTREEIAAWYLAVLNWQANAAFAVRLAGAAFAKLTDREATLSVHVGDRVVSVPGPQPRFELDVPELRAALLQLVEEGKLSQEAADDTCQPQGVNCPACDEFIPDGSFKVSNKALTNLRKTPEFNNIIEGCGDYRPRSRPLQVK